MKTLRSKTYNEHKLERHVPRIPLTGLHELSRSIIIRDIEPKAVRNSRGDTLAHAERIATDKVRAISVRIVESVKEMRSRWAQEVLDVLLEGVDVFPSWVFGNLNCNS